MSDSPTKDMRIDILAHITDQNIFDSLPVLKKLKTFVHYASHPLSFEYKQLFAFLILLYSDDSILNGHPMPSMEERQTMAAELSKFPMDKGKFLPDVYTSLFTLEDENEILLSMVTEYLISLGNLDWEEIVATERLRFNYLRSMMDTTALDDPAKLKNKSILKTEVEAMTVQLKNRYRDFFSNDDKLIKKGREFAHKDFIEDRAT